MRVPKIDKGKYKGAKKCTIEGGAAHKIVGDYYCFLVYNLFGGGKKK
jgi:hypothetical protein